MGLFDHDEEPKKIQIDDTARAHLLELSRWGKFMAIVVFIMMGLLILFGVILAASLTSLSNGFGGNPNGFSGSLLVLLFVFAAGVYFYPAFALYKYAVLAKKALPAEDQLMFNTALAYLKNAFKYIGVLMLILICIYVLTFIFGGLAGVLAGAFS